MYFTRKVLLEYSIHLFREFLTGLELAETKFPHHKWINACVEFYNRTMLESIFVYLWNKRTASNPFKIMVCSSTMTMPLNHCECWQHVKALQLLLLAWENNNFYKQGYRHFSFGTIRDGFLTALSSKL